MRTLVNAVAAVHALFARCSDCGRTGCRPSIHAHTDLGWRR